MTNGAAMKLDRAVDDDSAVPRMKYGTNDIVAIAGYTQDCILHQTSVPHAEIMLLYKLLNAGYVLRTTDTRPWLCGICSVKRGETINKTCACPEKYPRWSHAIEFVYHADVPEKRWDSYETLAYELELRGYDFHDYITPWTCGSCKINRSADVGKQTTCACDKKSQLNPADTNDRDCIMNIHADSDRLRAIDVSQIIRARSLNVELKRSRYEKYITIQSLLHDRVDVTQFYAMGQPSSFLNLRQ